MPAPNIWRNSAPIWRRSSVREAVAACVSTGVFERSPQPGISYHGFVDPSGGSGTDSMTLAVGHIDHAKQTVIVDAIREQRPPFSPEQVTQEFVSCSRATTSFKVIGDRYAGGYPPEQFGKFNILFEQAAKPKSELYGDLLPMINSCRIQLLDHPRLISQLCGLERRTARGGRDTIDHPPGGHDDIANCVAGLASINTQYPAYDHSYAGCWTIQTSTLRHRPRVISASSLRATSSNFRRASVVQDEHHAPTHR